MISPSNQFFEPSHQVQRMVIVCKRAPLLGMTMQTHAVAGDTLGAVVGQAETASEEVLQLQKK